MIFVEATPFTKHLRSYLSDEAYRTLQQFMTTNPEAGEVIPGTGGFRKLRWADERRGKGKRGGLRVIYYYFEGDDQLWMLTLYDKNEASDLTPEQKAALRKGLELEKTARSAGRSGGSTAKPRRRQ